MPSIGGRYRSLNDNDNGIKHVVTPYWKAVSYLSIWMLLGGFLMLPTTYDSNPQLRFSSGVIIVLVCSLLTGGYALTALLWFAVPSRTYRLENLLIPAASTSFFGLCAAAWALVSSPRFDPSLAGCPITLGLTFVSVLIYGGLGWWTSHQIGRATAQKAAWPVSGTWRDSSSVNFNPHTSSTYPLTAPTDNAGIYYAHPAVDYAHPLHDYPPQSQDYVPTGIDYSQHSPLPQPLSQQSHAQHRQSLPLPTPTVVEEDMVGHQMASLLSKPTPIPSPEATQETFRLEWPPGGDDTVSPHRNRSQSFNGSSQLLSPNDAAQRGRHRNGSGGALRTVGTVLSVDRRGRPPRRSQEEREERAKSRDERRREIEHGEHTLVVP